MEDIKNLKKTFLDMLDILYTRMRMGHLHEAT